MSRSWRRGSTRRWRKIRLAVLDRDRWLCQVKIRGVCTTVATCVHHTMGSDYGDDPAYLVACCQPCNNRVHKPGTTSAHQRVVAWARANGPVTPRALARQFPNVTEENIDRILNRARSRGELVRIAPGTYEVGPTGLPIAETPDPQPRSVTLW